MSELLREDDAFYAFLDHVIAVARGEDLLPSADEDDEPELSEAEQVQAVARARELLAAQALAPDDMTALDRLFRLWMWLDRPDAARAALDAHEARLLDDLAHAERLEAAEACARWRISAATREDGMSAVQLQALFEAATDAIGACQALPEHDDRSLQSWYNLMDEALSARQPDTYERGTREVHAIYLRQSHRRHWRCFDEATLQLRLALTSELRGDKDGAAALARKAAQTLATPGPDQIVEEDDWWRLAHDLVRLAPDTLAQVCEGAQRALGQDASPALRRDQAVKLARLTAGVQWAQGDHTAALATARQGRFMLVQDEEDGFTATVLTWLMQTGQEEQAARMALEACWHSRPISSRRAVELALQRLSAETEHTGLWTLALASAAHEEALNEDDLLALGHATVAEAQHRLIDRARALLPGHPLPDVLQGMQLANQGQHEQALPMLERLLERPDMANQGCASQLWYTRMRVLGAEQAVDQRFVETGAGNWSYALGVILSTPNEVMDSIELPAERRSGFPRDALIALSTRYYELALAQFEAFFATGEGNVRDGDIHTYSMNCNNLAIRYRHASRAEEALVLHQKGLASSPFAEHKHGALNCLDDLKRYSEYIDAAEQLWHFALEQGYSRHDPCDYFGDVAWALQHLDRAHEIEIWLDRLRQWRGMLSQSDLQAQQPRLLGAEAAILDFLYRSKPEDTLARMLAIRPELMRIGRTWGLRRLGDGLLDAGEAQAALETYERAVAVFDPDLDREAARASALEGIDKAKAAIRKQKPFWRRWF
ncbi:MULTISPECIES: hypothetical protein [unclassified Pseudomonas]|uniref:hypothetical protein n=1 Tax=unclassified Pseudomonas TaxID=196821 RepID=UPI00244D28A7|nr:MULTISPECIES: hypothetical protein [unclassified Pseudomonas]MDG9926952.1 hypothetical protein [Pseudomonas sp. GD04042]MDH0484595.1 hypothetical protein [Pseudomonas sp. GD04015]MDH0602367.1 hypothetical protein [Pseudomonas sp. GD03869]